MAVFAQARSAQSAAGHRRLGVNLPLLALAVFFAGQCVVDAFVAISQQSTFSEYLNHARRCVELNDCPSRGGRTGGLPLFHGASWIRLLSYSLRTGGDQTQVQTIILALWILSIPVTFFFLKRYLGMRAATLALGLYFPVILVGTDITMFTYTNLLPLPFAVYYAGIALFVELRRVVFAAVASVALAAAVSAELGGIVMVPFHFLLVALVAPRPVPAIVATGLAFAVPFCLDSMDAALEIVRQVPTLRFAVALVICGAAAPLFARLGRRALLDEARPARDRVRAVMVAGLVYATATVWLGNVFLSHGVPAPRYFLPASFPFLYLVAERMGSLGARSTIALAGLEAVALLFLPFAPRGQELLQVPVALIVTIYAAAIVLRPAWRSVGAATGQSWPAVTICAAALAISVGEIVLVAKRGEPQTFTLAEAERLLPRLYSAGYTYPQLLASLQGPAIDDVVSLLTERDPELFRTPAPRLASATFSLLVVKVPNDAIPRTTGVVAAVPVDDARSLVVVRDDRPYLDWVRMRRCLWRNGVHGCAQPRTDRSLPHNWPYVEFGDPLPDPRPPSESDRGRVRYEVPVRTPGRGAPHIVRLTNEWPSAWRIVGVSGVDFEGELPGPEIRLTDTREAAGTVEMEFDHGVAGDLPWVWMPHAMEVAEENEHLLESFRGAS